MYRDSANAFRELGGQVIALFFVVFLATGSVLTVGMLIFASGVVSLQMAKRSEIENEEVLMEGVPEAR